LNTFGEKLKKARKSKRLRQADLARNIGISQTTVANYEGGVRFPKEAILKKLSEELEVSLDYLLSTVDPLGLERDPEEDRVLTSLLTASFGEIQERYLDLLLKGEQKEATDLILNTLRIGRTVEDIYTEILAPALVQVGELWQQGNIHVAQEHYVSEATQGLWPKFNRYRPPIVGKNGGLSSFPSAGSGTPSEQKWLRIFSPRTVGMCTIWGLTSPRTVLSKALPTCARICWPYPSPCRSTPTPPPT